MFFGSVSSSLAIMNLFYLYFLFTDKEIKVIRFVDESEGADGLALKYDKWKLYLWTVGALIHTMLDMAFWSIAACSMCEPGGKFAHKNKYTWTGTVALFCVVFSLTVFAVFLWYARAVKVTEEETFHGNSTEFFAFDIENDTKNVTDHGYLGAWAISFLVSVFVYNGIVSTILFSGIFGCGGRIVMLGGRPFEIRQLAKKRRKLRKKERKRKMAASMLASDSDSKKRKGSKRFPRRSKVASELTSDSGS